jgi:uncharacterized protein (TIGR03066 family)
MRTLVAILTGCWILPLLAAANARGVPVPTADPEPPKQVVTDREKDLIVGKWMPADEKQKDTRIEFLRDGKLKVSAAGLNFNGKYRFIQAGVLEVEITIEGNAHKQKAKVKVTRNELVTTNEKGTVDKFKRVK